AGAGRARLRPRQRAEPGGGGEGPGAAGAPGGHRTHPAGGRVVAGISVVLDHTTAGALYDPKDPFNEAVAAFYVQASGGLGELYAPVPSLTARSEERRV